MDTVKERSEFRDNFVVDRTHQEDFADNDNENYVKEGAMNNNNETEFSDQLQKPSHEPLILPDVPTDNHEDLVKVSCADLDEQILARLTKLKLFSHAWSQTAAAFNVTFEDSSASDSVHEKVDTYNSLGEEFCPVYSSEQDRLDFNHWYYETIDKVNQKVSQQNIDNTIHTESTEELNLRGA